MATLDVLVCLKEMPTWECGTSVSSFRLDGGGPVGTALVAAARLGARAGFVGTAGNDEAAGLKLRSMVEAGVDLRRLIVRPEPEDQIVFVYVHSETGERIFAGLHDQHSALQVDELDPEYITSAEYLLLDGFHYGAVLQASRWMRGAGKQVVLDGHEASGPVNSHIRALLGNVDILISGSGFAQALTGISDIWEAGMAVLKMGPDIYVQTEGREGSYTVSRDERFHTPAFDVDVVDTTGAGDVFHGAYVFGLLCGWDYETVATFSTAVSALKCTKLGGRHGIPYLNEVTSFLNERGISISRRADEP